MSEEWVIALKPYEKAAIKRFMALFLLAYLVVFTAVASLYYYKEYNRMANENIARHRIKVAECQRFSRFDPKLECQNIKIENTFDLESVYKEILITFVLATVLFLLFSYLLARQSLKPVRDSINLMDNFINTIIHDINTPLSIIKINASGLQKKVEDPKLKNRSTRILNAIETIESLEDQLLFSIRTHTMQLEDHAFDLQKLIEDSLETFRAIDSDIMIRYEGESTLVYADKDALFRVLLNLVSNAVKFSPSHSMVVIILKNNHLFIEDAGPGIEDTSRVFDKYYREKSSQKGLGLGLFIVHEICRRYDIKIAVQSSSKGTRFDLDLTNILK